MSTIHHSGAEVSELPVPEAGSGRELRDGIRLIAIVSGIYVGLQLISNIASLKIGVVLGLAVDLGTFCYPFTFTIRDLAHRVLGKRGVTGLVFTSFGVNLAASAYLALCAIVPGEDSEAAASFSFVFSPMWRLVAASLAAMLLSELADTQVYHLVRNCMKNRLWMRVLLSNAVSIPIDNLVFSLGAFAGVLPWNVVWEIFLFNLIVKAVVSVIGFPLIYLIPKRFDRI